MNNLQLILKSYDIGYILHAWTRDYYWLSRLIFAISYISGMFTIFRALYYLKVYGEARTMMATQSSAAAPIAMFICGASLIFLPTAIDTLTYTLYNTNSALSYDSGGTGYGN
ncbi:MAG: icmC dotE, partial [Gammaproteobacteria bacterium]|nr:icmC dotE [Gammaproteobacteria bacterium]